MTRQSLTVDCTIAVDNDPSDRLRDEVGVLLKHVYLPVPSNIGPAGGIAAGMSYVLSLAGDEDWIVLVDDDNAPTFDDQIELWSRLQ